MKNILILLCFIPGLLSLTATAQEYKFYRYPDKLPESYEIDKKSQYDDFQGTKIKGVSPEQFTMLKEVLVYAKDDMIRGGEIYIGWQELEDYLNKIVTLILPDSLKNDKNIHVYPYRMSDYNAFTMYDGTIVYSIGLFADSESEAAIAAILGHELSHFVNGDVINRIERYVKLSEDVDHENDYATLRNMMLTSATQKQHEEMRCDIQGFQYTLKQGYDGNSSLTNFYRLVEMENEKDTKKIGASLSNVYVVENEEGGKEEKTNSELFSSHPEAVRRVKALRKFINERPSGGKGKEFIINQALFNKLKLQARYETLNLLLTNNDYKECMEKAFKYYLFEPDNQVYTYCLLESLRRFLYTKPVMANQAFLSQAYADHLKEGQTVLNNLNVLIRDSVKTAAIKATDFKNGATPKFRTYKEALQYFGKLAMDKNIKEAYLTMGIYYSGNNDQRAAEVLKKYLSFIGVNHKDYADALMRKSVNSFVGKNHIMLFQRSDFYDCMLKERYFVKYENAAANDPVYIKEIKNFYVSKGQQREVLYMPALDDYAFNKKMDFYNVISTLGMIRKMERESYNPLGLNIFTVDPYYWDFFVSNDIESFDWIYTYAKGKCGSGSPRFKVHYYSYNPQLPVNKEYGAKEYVSKQISPELAIKTIQKIEKERVK